MAVSWGFSDSFLVAVEAVVHLMGAGPPRARTAAADRVGQTADRGRGCGSGVFRDPPGQRNRVWQMDFSEFETARGVIWRICAVIDYATKYCLAATVTPTSRGQDALGSSAGPLSRPNGSSTSTTSVPTAA